MASKITIPDLKKIRVTDPLFSHYAGMVAKKMIPVQWEILNGKQGQSRCFCIDNFRIAGGTLQGEHRGVVFGDTDAYKWLEAVAYCANNGETEYIPQADELIEIIGQAPAAGRLPEYIFHGLPSPSFAGRTSPRATSSTAQAISSRPPLPTITRPASAACSTSPQSSQISSAKPSATARVSFRLSRPSGDRACAREALARDGRGALPEDGALLH